MSSIDDRIVDMQFNSDSFEKNIDSSIKSLQNLNDALELKGASDGLENVMVAVKAVDLSAITDGVKTVADKFNIIGAVGLSVINKLTGALMGFAGDSINAIVDPLVEGGKRRAQNIEQAKFMIQGLGKSWEKLKGDMEFAVSGTAFGLDSAAKAASQLSASSVKAGDDMRNALRGISGVAAMTGSSYDDIAQIFTTVAGNGRLMASELNRVSHRGLNAAQALADYYNEGRKGAKLTEKDVREMVTKGKVSFKEFAEAMDGAFGAQATKANETYAGSLSNVKSALSRIGEQFVTPVFEKQKDIFNQLRLVINGVSTALKPFIKLWGEVQKASGEATVNLLKDVEKSIGFLSNSPNTIANQQIEAYNKYQAAKNKGSKDAKKLNTDEAKEGKKRLAEQKKLQDAELAAQKKYDAEMKKYKKGDKKGKEPKKPQILLDKEEREKTGGQEQTPFVQSIAAVTDGLRALYNTANTVFGAIREAFAEAFPKDPAAKSLLLTLAEGFKAFATWLQPSAEQLETFKKALSGFFLVLKLVFTVVSNVFQAIPGIFQVVIGVFKLLGAVFKPVIDLASQLATSFLAMFKSTAGGVDVISMVNDALTWLRENGLGKLLDIIGNATKAVIDFWAGMGSGDGGNLFAGFDPFAGMLEQLKNFGATMSEFFHNAWEWAKGIYESISSAMGEFKGGAGGFFSGIGNAIKAIGGWLDTTFVSMKSGFSEFFKNFDWSTLLAGLSFGAFLAIATKLVNQIMGVFKVFNQASNFMNLLKSSIIDGLDALTGAINRFGEETKSDKLMKIGKAIMFFAIAVGILAAAFWVLSKVDTDDMTGAALGMISILGALSVGLYALAKAAGEKSIIKMSGVAAALILLSVSLLIMAKAMQVLGKVEPDRLLPSVAALTIGLVAMAVTLESISKDPKKLVAAAFAMGLLANALLVMAGAVAILGLMPMDMLIQGGIALAGIMALLMLFAAVPSDNVLKAGIAMGILAVALNLIVGAIALLGIMDFGTLIQGGLAIAVIIAGLVTAANMLKSAEGGAAAMLAMAAALAILIIPIKTFATMDSGALAQGIGATIIMLIGLVGAANLMQNAVPGAAAMVVMAIALGILAGAVWVLAQIPADQLMNAFLMIAGGLAVLLAAAAIASMGPVTAGLFILAGAILAIGLAVGLAGAGVIMMSMGFATLGIALQASIPGLLAFAAACVQMLPQMLAMVALAVALAALAVAVAALGVAFILLGTGLMAVGVGMALLAAFGGVGAIAVLAIWKALEPLIWSIPQIGLLGAAFLALGVGLTALGVGLALASVGTVAMAIGMLALVGAGFAFSAALDSTREALERFVPIAAQLTTITTQLSDFGNSFRDLNGALTGLGINLTSAGTGFATFASLSAAASKAIAGLPQAIGNVSTRTKASLSLLVAAFKVTSVSLGNATIGMGAQVQNGSASIIIALAGIIRIVVAFSDQLTAQGPVINASAVKMLGSLGPTITGKLKGLGPSLKSTATSVGRYITDGLRNGINDGTGSVVSAARAMAKRVINAVKDEFKIKSPSKVMEELGKYVTEGFYKGLTGFEDAPVHRVIEAVNNMKEELKKAIDEADADIKSYKDKVNELSKKKKKSSKDKKDLAAAKNDLKAAEDVKKKSEEAMKQLDGALKAQQDQLMKVSDQYDIVIEKVKNAASALANAEKEMADAQKNYTDQFNKLPDFAEDGDVVGTYVADIQKQIDATMKFAESIAYLRNMGLDNVTYKKLLEKGVDAQPFIDALIQSGQAGIDQINELDSELEDVASALGTTAAKEMYQNGVDMARGLLEGLQAQEAQLKAEMEKLGQTIVDTIKKELGIKSPSRVFAEVGGYSMLGLMNGMQKYLPALERTASDVGDTAISGLRKAIDEIGASVYGEMDMSPVIRPVLDLTDVENSAKQLGSVFSSKSIDVGSVYANASDIALASRARELLTEQQHEDALSNGDSVTFIQNNNSPKAISNIDLYRQTRNQLSDIKKGLPK